MAHFGDYVGTFGGGRYCHCELYLTRDEHSQLLIVEGVADIDRDLEVQSRSYGRDVELVE
jgi:hypothetical protein